MNRTWKQRIGRLVDIIDRIGLSIKKQQRIIRYPKNKHDNMMRLQKDRHGYGSGLYATAKDV